MTYNIPFLFESEPDLKCCMISFPTPSDSIRGLASSSNANSPSGSSNYAYSRSDHIHSFSGSGSEDRPAHTGRGCNVGEHRERKLYIKHRQKVETFANEVYDKVLPTMYKRPNFNKFDGSGNSGDHISIEYRNIANNEKLKLQ